MRNPAPISPAPPRDVNLATEAERARDRFTRLQELLGRYTSRVIIDALLRSAAERAEVPLPPLSTAQFQKLVNELALGLQLFCPARDLPKLKLGLRELIP
ncbi:MAG: hypothetical protein U1A78_30075 [Polyangia bacterium]